MSIVTISYYYITMSIYEILGNNIRNLRKAYGWSQATLAEKVDLSVSYITMIELGQRSASLEVIEIIARSLNVPVAELFREEDVKKDIKNKRINDFEKEFHIKLKNLIEECIE